MRGYAALARIEATNVHVARAPILDRAERGAAVVEPEVLDEALQPSLGARAVELAERIREQWAITTFYLFDPESWR